MSEIFVIGHRNPDTDAICSAVGYAEFKRRTGMPEAVAARCGDTNDRIDFVLNTFGVPAPRFVASVSPTIADVMQRQIMSVKPTATAADALQLMDTNNIRILPVLDENRRCRGLLSLFKLSKFLFPAANHLGDSRRILSSLQNLAKTLQGELLVKFEHKREEDLIMMIGAMSVDSFADRLEGFLREKLIVVVGDRTDIQEAAIKENVRLVIVTGGLKVEARILKAAERNGVSVMPHSAGVVLRAGADGMRASRIDEPAIAD